VTGTLADYEWQPVSTSGSFNKEKQILLRNRYNDGKYGYEVLTLFTSKEKKNFWVDRGWVQAGATATTPPVLTPLPEGEVTINGRLRLDSSLPRGSFFALPGKGEGLVSELNAQSQLNTEKFYIDLLSGSQASLTPEVPAQLPELSDGPHMAYALQWIFFGGLVIYGRILIRRTR
jgi:surfeit locus 1 family protein